VVACYYALAYLGFAAPYLAAGLGAVTSQAGAFGILAGIAVVIAVGTAGYGLTRGRADRVPDPPAASPRGVPRRAKADQDPHTGCRGHYTGDEQRRTVLAGHCRRISLATQSGTG
jgi:hypothetical protein